MPLITPGSASTADVRQGVKFSSGPLYNVAGTMQDYGDNELILSGATMGNGYITLTNNTDAFVNSGTTFSFNSGVISPSKIMQGQNILGLDGTATSDANATAAQILSGRTAYVNGVKLTGTMAALNPLSSGYISSSAPSSVTGSFIDWNISTTITANKVLLGLHVKMTNDFSNYPTWSVFSGVRMHMSASWQYGGTYNNSIMGNSAGQVTCQLTNVSYTAASGALTFTYRYSCSTGVLSYVGTGNSLSINYVLA